MLCSFNGRLEEQLIPTITTTETKVLYAAVDCVEVGKGMAGNIIEDETCDLTWHRNKANGEMIPHLPREY